MIYEFQCNECKMIFEEITSDRELRTTKCHNCGGVAVKIMSPAGWDIKGGGVYRSGPPAPTKKSSCGG